MDVGSTLRSFRELRGLTQQDLADAMGVSQGAVSTWERNTVELSVKDLHRLMPILEIDLLVFCRELLSPSD